MTPPPPPDADGFSADDAAAALGLAAGEVADLAAFRERLEAANAVMNLVGPSALGQFWRRHVLDSGQLLDLAPEAERWADIGAGAGFPGLVLAIRCKARGRGRVLLVEAQAKRCRFLQETADALALPAEVRWARAESLAPEAVDIVTARACAPLARLLGYASPLLRAGVRGLFLKGRTAEAEVAEARRSWRFTARLHPSRSDAEGRIIDVEGLTRA